MAKAYQVKDPYFLKAKQDGYRARSAYKLLDIQTRFQILRPNQTVLDLGSAPGSFLQVLAKIVGKDGYVFGLDLQPIERFKQTNIKTAVCDILDTVAVDALLESWGITKIDVMTSDLAPNTSGIRDVDQARSVELVEMAFEVAKRILRPNGNFIAKVFQGEDLQLLMPKLKQNFRKVTLFNQLLLLCK